VGELFEQGEFEFQLSDCDAAEGITGLFGGA